MSRYYEIPKSLRDHWDGTRAKEFGGPKFPHDRTKCKWCINHAEVTKETDAHNREQIGGAT